jgi:hypothetical protein
MTLLYAIGFVTAALIWGDWRNWQKYYSTILFTYVVNLVELVLTYNYTLWRFHDSLPGLPNHVPTVFVILFINFTSSILIFLGRFPHRKWQQLLWTLLFIAINSLLEWIALPTHHITYDHGWTFGWSVAINCLMYLILRLHYTRPPLAWAVTLACFVFFIWHFHIPIRGLK